MIQLQEKFWQKKIKLPIKTDEFCAKGTALSAVIHCCVRIIHYIGNVHVWSREHPVLHLWGWVPVWATSPTEGSLSLYRRLRTCFVTNTLGFFKVNCVSQIQTKETLYTEGMNALILMQRNIFTSSEVEGFQYGPR